MNQIDATKEDGITERKGEKKRRRKNNQRKKKRTESSEIRQRDQINENSRRRRGITLKNKTVKSKRKGKKKHPRKSGGKM